MALRTLIAATAAAVLVSGCATSPHLEPVKASSTTIDLLCVKLNPDSPAPEFVDELRGALTDRHIRTLVYGDTPPAGCHYHMLYWTEFRFDNRMNLYRAILRVYQGDDKIGEAVYDAPMNTPLSFQKDTSTKLSGMLDRLFPNRG